MGGILAGLGLVVAKISQNSQKSINQVKTATLVQDYDREIKSVLGQYDLCTKNFKKTYDLSKSFKMEELGELQNKRGQVFLKKGLKKEGLEVTELETKWLSDGYLELSVGFSRNQASYGVRTLYKKYIIEPRWKDVEDDSAFFITETRSDGSVSQRPPREDEVGPTLQFDSCVLSGRDMGGGSGLNQEQICSFIEGANFDLETKKCVVGDVYLCLEEKRQLSESEHGGMTTKCHPHNEHIPGTKLTGGKERQKCLDDGGAYYHDDLGKVSMCQFDGESCPSGWSYNGYRSGIDVVDESVIPLKFRPLVLPMLKGKLARERSDYLSPQTLYTNEDAGIIASSGEPRTKTVLAMSEFEADKVMKAQKEATERMKRGEISTKRYLEISKTNKLLFKTVPNPKYPRRFSNGRFAYNEKRIGFSYTRKKIFSFESILDPICYSSETGLYRFERFSSGCQKPTETYIKNYYPYDNIIVKERRTKVGCQ